MTLPSFISCGSILRTPKTRPRAEVHGPALSDRGATSYGEALLLQRFLADTLGPCLAPRSTS